ncbi:SPOR domain-containing protein [bacterium]|nr:SPOR domain-containing protein [bacterium]
MVAPVEPAPQLQNYEYSIQVGSYRYLPQALEARDRLVQAGLRDVYVAPVILDSLGSWNRLYVGYFSSSAQADTVLARILPELRKVAPADNEPGLAIKRRTPWAISLGDFGPADSLEAFRSRLSGYDIPSYAVEISADSSGNKKFRLYVGAFEDQDQAVFIRSRLFDVGVKGSIEEREGPAEAEPAKPQGQV